MEIVLTQGQITLVDEEDYEYLMQWNWCPLVTPQTIYALKSVSSKYNTTASMHRVIGARMGFNPDLMTHHKDHHGLNNQRCNLKEATAVLNSQDALIRVDNVTGVRGVNFHSKENKWSARIQIGNQRLSLGSFTRFEDAVAARLAAEKRYYKWREPATGVNSSS